MGRSSDSHRAELRVLRSHVDTLTKRVDDQGAHIQELQARRWPLPQVMMVVALFSLGCTFVMLWVALKR